ncbi:hypothetical protein LTR95_007122 [Oleoguttula sp. CCFEE 5521]
MRLAHLVLPVGNLLMNPFATASFFDGSINSKPVFCLPKGVVAAATPWSQLVAEIEVAAERISDTRGSWQCISAIGTAHNYLQQLHDHRIYQAGLVDRALQLHRASRALEESIPLSIPWLGEGCERFSGDIFVLIWQSHCLPPLLDVHKAKAAIITAQQDCNHIGALFPSANHLLKHLRTATTFDCDKKRTCPSYILLSIQT